MQQILSKFTGVVLVTLVASIGILAQNKIDYPKTKTVQQVDNYHGTEVSDPYRWLESPDSDDTKAWVESQNKVTNDYLKTIPQREQIKQRLTKLWNYEKFSAPSKQGGKYFYYKNDGLQNQYVLYVADSIEDEGRILLNPNNFSDDGTTSLAGTAVSRDGKIIAYGISKGGSDWREYRFRNIETGKDLPDVLRYIKFSGLSWSKDGNGVYYAGYPKPNEKSKLEDANFYRKLYFHRIGTKQSKDKLIYERPDNKKLGVNGFVTDDGNWLLIYLSQGSSPKDQIYFKNLNRNDSPILPLVDKFEANYSFIDNIGGKVFFNTDKDAPLGKVVSVNLLDKDKKWNEIIPEGDETLRGVSLLNNHFVLNYLKDAYTQIQNLRYVGKLCA